MTGRLTVVATPIGNLDDLSPRGAAALRDADLVLAEDTRHTGRLLAHVGASTPQQAYHDHNEREVAARVVVRIQEGATVVLVSDAGTPAVSDPGYRLVAACAAAGVVVDAVPGPSAVLHALVTSGLPTDRFTFEGFLPRKGLSRTDRLAAIAASTGTTVLFASPHRAQSDLQDLAAACGEDRPAAVGRELTKLHEETVRGPLAELAERESWRGELTVVVAGAPDVVDGQAEMNARLEQVTQLVDAGLSRRDAVQAVATLTGTKRRALYEADLWRQ